MMIVVEWFRRLWPQSTAHSPRACLSNRARSMASAVGPYRLCIFRSNSGEGSIVKPHTVCTYKSAEHIARSGQLAWKIAEAATDPAAVVEDVVEAINNAAVAAASSARRPVASALDQANAHRFRSAAIVFKLAQHQRISPESTDSGASEGLDGGVARAKLYVEARAKAILPEALKTAEMFYSFAQCMPGLPLVANTTEFGRRPFFAASEFEETGSRVVIWPVSSLRVANKAQEQLCAAMRSEGGPHNRIDQMQTRPEFSAAIGLHDYEMLDTLIIQTIIPRDHFAGAFRASGGVREAVMNDFVRPFRRPAEEYSAQFPLN